MKLPVRVTHKYVTLAKSTKEKLSLAKGLHTLRILSWNECTVQSERSIMEMLTDLHHQWMQLQHCIYWKLMKSWIFIYKVGIISFRLVSASQ